MRKLNILIVVLLLIGAALAWHLHAPLQTVPASTASTAANTVILPAWLPRQAHRTMQLIAQGGTFPHHQDGSIFGNRESLLPKRPRGFYHEYTVETPGSKSRGSRRIISAGNPPAIYYYTDDHYRSFRSFKAGHEQ